MLAPRIQVNQLVFALLLLQHLLVLMLVLPLPMLLLPHLQEQLQLLERLRSHLRGDGLRQQQQHERG